MSENMFEGEPTDAAAVTAEAPSAAEAAPAAEAPPAAEASPAPSKRGRSAGSKTKTAEAETDPVAPLVAAAKIVYGDRKEAMPGDFFVPVTEAERDYLLGLDGVVAELTDAELALFEKMNG